MATPGLLIIHAEDRAVQKITRFLGSDFSLYIAESAEKGLQIYEHYADRLVFVLLDKSANDIPLQDVLRRMKSISLIPEIVVTSDQSDDVETAVTAIQNGAIDFFGKEIPVRDYLIKFLELMDAIDSSKKRDFLDPGASDELNIQKRFYLFHEFLRKRRLAGKSLAYDELISLIPSSRTDSDITLEDLFDSYHAFCGRLVKTGTRETLLVVDDEPSVQTYMMKMLGDNYTVIVAKDSDEAVEIASTRNDIAVILLDIFLPNIKGTEIIPILSSILPQTPIIAITAYKLVDAARESLFQGAVDHILKPFELESLKKKIKMALDSAQYDRFIDGFESDIAGAKISFEDRVDLFQRLVKRRFSKGQSVKLKDVNRLFPECANPDIYDKTLVPSHLLKEGQLEVFLAELENRRHTQFDKMG